MPFLRKYDYRCPAGHIFEMTVDRYIESMLCLCGLDAKLTWLKFPGTLAHSNAQRFDPVVVFRKPDGSLYVPGRSNERTPQGMKRIELTSAQAVRRFENEQDARLKSIKEQKLEREDSGFRPLRKARRETLKAQMEGREPIVNREGKKVYHNFSGPGRKFAEFAMKKADERPSLSRQAQKYDPGFHVECFSVDSSNRSPHNDTDTGFKDKR